jgi:hypothetical protein
MNKLLQNLLLLGLVGTITNCATDVPNRPVTQSVTPVTMKSIDQFTVTPQQSTAQHPIKCPKGKKGYRCRHPKKAQLSSEPNKQVLITTPEFSPNYRFESGAVFEVREVSTAAGTLTVKNVSLLQNQHGDLILSKGMVLKLLCTTKESATLSYINGKKFAIPVMIQNGEHKTTGCNKTDGAIQYLQITDNVK